MSKQIIRIFWVGMLCMPARAYSKAPAQVYQDEVIAWVGDEVILRSTWMQACASYLERAPKNMDKAALRKEVLKVLVQRKCLLHAARKEDFTPTQRELAPYIHQRLGEYLQHNRGKISAEELACRRNIYHQEAVENSLVEYMMGKITRDVHVCPAQVKAYFAKADHPYQAEKLHLVELRFTPQLTAAKQACIRKAHALRKDVLLGKAKLEDIARKYSQDASSRKQGGELGYVPQGVLDSAYEKAVEHLAVGEVSMPVVSAYGVHLIGLIDRKAGMSNTRHVLLLPYVDAASQEQAKGAIDAWLTEHSQLDVYACLDKLMPVQENQRTPSAFLQQWDMHAALYDHGDVSVDDLPSELFLAAEGLGVQERSALVCYERPDGKEVISCLCVQKRTLPHAASLAQDYNFFYERVKAEKKEQALGAWLQKQQSQIAIRVKKDLTY